MSNNKEWLAIVNPNAGNGKGLRDWHRIAEFMRQVNLSFKVKFTDYKGHAVLLTKEAAI